LRISTTAARSLSGISILGVMALRCLPPSAGFGGGVLKF
jgi:hypothetical protein